MKFCRYTPCFSYNFSSTSHVFINIHEYKNKIIYISKRAVSESLFGTKFGTPGHLTTEI